MRYSGEQWQVEKAESDFILRATTARHELHKGRVLRVSPRGVHECSRDGKDTPLALVDCNPEIFKKALTELAAKTTGEA